MAERGDLFLGFDVGTTAVKGALFDIEGRLVAHSARPYPTSRPAPSIVEQDPRDWTDGVVKTMDALLVGDRAGRVAAVGLCGQTNTDVFVGADGAPLAPAIAWADNRAAPEAASLDAGVTAQDRLAWWGAPLPIGASHVLARMAWMAREKPEIFAATRHVLTPKDYCLRALVGEAVADPMSNFFVVGLDLAYVDPLISRVAGARERLPALRFFTDIVGEIALGSTGKRVPVVAGTMDAWSGLFGAGVRRAGQGVYISGTSEILAIASARRIGAPGIVTFPTAAGLTINAGPTQSGGDSLQWWGGVIGRDVEGVLTLASEAESQRTADPVPAASRRRARPFVGRAIAWGVCRPRPTRERTGPCAGGHGGRGALGPAAARRLRRGGGRSGAAPVSRRRRSALRSLGADQSRLPRTAAGSGRLSRRRLPGRRDHGGGWSRGLPIACRGDLGHDACRAFVRAGSAHESPLRRDVRRLFSRDLGASAARSHWRFRGDEWRMTASSPRHHAAASISPVLPESSRDWRRGCDPNCRRRPRATQRRRARASPPETLPSFQGRERRGAGCRAAFRRLAAAA